MDVEGEHNPAPDTSAPSTASTAALTAAAQVRPITSLFQREENSSTPVPAAAAAAAAGTATGANQTATGVFLQAMLSNPRYSTPLQVCGSSNYFRTVHGSSQTSQFGSGRVGSGRVS